MRVVHPADIEAILRKGFPIITECPAHMMARVTAFVADAVMSANVIVVGEATRWLQNVAEDAHPRRRLFCRPIFRQRDPELFAGPQDVHHPTPHTAAASSPAPMARRSAAGVIVPQPCACSKLHTMRRGRCRRYRFPWRIEPTAANGGRECQRASTEKRPATERRKFPPLCLSRRAFG